MSVENQITALSVVKIAIKFSLCKSENLSWDRKLKLKLESIHEKRCDQACKEKIKHNYIEFDYNF